MPVLLTRRGLIGGAVAAGASFASVPARAAPSQYGYETDVWTGGVLQDQDGSSFVLRDLRRPITLLKLWAAWCPACASEMPQLAGVADAMARDVEVILVSHPQYWEADLAAARRRKLPFRLATFASLNPASIVQQALTNQAGQYAVPRSLVFRQRDCAIISETGGTRDWSLEATARKLRTWVG